MIRICKCCMHSECIDCSKSKPSRCTYGEAKPGGIRGSKCEHGDAEWKTFLCTDCKGFYTAKDFTSDEDIRQMLQGGCENGYHSFGDELELPLTLNNFPGGGTVIDGFQCVNCGCPGHLHISPKMLQWLDKAEQESIDQYMFEEGVSG